MIKLKLEEGCSRRRVTSITGRVVNSVFNCRLVLKIKAILK